MAENRRPQVDPNEEPRGKASRRDNSNSAPHRPRTDIDPVTGEVRGTSETQPGTNPPGESPNESFHRNLHPDQLGGGGENDLNGVPREADVNQAPFDDRDQPGPG